MNNLAGICLSDTFTRLTLYLNSPFYLCSILLKFHFLQRTQQREKCVVSTLPTFYNQLLEFSKALNFLCTSKSFLLSIFLPAANLSVFFYFMAPTFKNIGTQGVQELLFCDRKDRGDSSIHGTVCSNDLVNLVTMESKKKAENL